MACFVVPAAEAVITTVLAKVVQSREKEETSACVLSDGSAVQAAGIKFSTKLGWLNKMLWGGSALLALEHVWHGEIVPFFPFLTAVANGETAGMLAEMGTVGVAMAALVTAVWAGILTVTSALERRALAEPEPAEEGVSA